MTSGGRHIDRRRRVSGGRKGDGRVRERERKRERKRERMEGG